MTEPSVLLKEGCGVEDVRETGVSISGNDDLPQRWPSRHLTRMSSPAVNATWPQCRQLFSVSPQGPVREPSSEL